MRKISTEGPIIFVDDDTDDQFIFKEACFSLGVTNKLIFFSMADELLDYLRNTNEQPFLIFCDINMPQKNGLELRRNINDEERLRRKSIPFVFLSTAATPHQVAEAYDLTVQGFFLKEKNLSATQSMIKMIIDYWRKCFHPNLFSGKL